MKITLIFLTCFIGQVLTKFSNGFYNDHPAYRMDDPPRVIAKLIPYGLPRGGKSSQKGLPNGLLAYATKYGSWKNMLIQYQKSRMLEKAYRMKSYRAYDAWSRS